MEQASPPIADGTPLPACVTTLTPEGVVARLDALARRGRLAGFGRADAPDLFRADAHSAPFDHDLIARGTPERAGTRLEFRLAMRRRIPALFGGAIVLTIFPGVWLTESMLSTYFSWYRLSIWWTMAWYIPLTVLPLPWALAAMVRRSRRAAREEALAIIARIEGELGAARER